MGVGVCVCVHAQWLFDSDRLCSNIGVCACVLGCSAFYVLGIDVWRMSVGNGVSVVCDRGVDLCVWGIVFGVRFVMCTVWLMLCGAWCDVCWLWGLCVCASV